MSAVLPSPSRSLAPLFLLRLTLLCLLCLLLGRALPAVAAASPVPAAWGQNNYGQLGIGTTTDSTVPVNVTTSGVLAGKTITQITNGFNYTLALCSDGTLAAWGFNGNGQLGNGTSGSATSSKLPIDITGSGALAGKTVTQISAFYSHSLALCSDGTLVAWGHNGSGALGDGTNTDSNVPLDITGKGALAGKTVTQIAAGYLTGAALCSDGTIATWGENIYGQLGDGTNADSNVPLDITGKGALAGKTVVKIALGQYFSLALCSDGSLISWGNNNDGQLGNGTQTNSQTPIDITRNGALTGKTVTQIKTGFLHCFALCSDGTLTAWGNNVYGQLGNGTNGSGVISTLPIDITGSGALAGKTVTQIGLNGYHSLAICSDGTLAAWGFNAQGQLGDGTTTYSNVPVAVTGGALSGSFATSVSAGGSFSSALYLPDGIAPSVAYTAPAPNAKVALSSFVAASISGTASDDQSVASVKVRLSRKRNNTNEFWNGTDWVSNSLTFVEADLTGAGTTSATWSLNDVPPTNKLDSGLYGVRIYALDASGNQRAPLDRFFTLYTDITVPTVTINSPTSSQVIKASDFTTSSLSGTATDNVGVTQVQLKLQRKVGSATYYWNGSDFTPTVAKFDAAVTTVGGASVTWQLAQTIPADKLTKGSYTLYATAYDAAGNFKTSPSRIFAIIGTPAASDATPAANSAGRS